MDKNVNDTSKITSMDTGTSALGVTDATSTESPRDNEALKAKYDEMHKQGPSAWFSDGREERETILKMGEPWEGLSVFEIGCGEGDLCARIIRKAKKVKGIDYSKTAIEKAKKKYPEFQVTFDVGNYDSCTGSSINSIKWDRLVMQGVLEHLDDPFGELQWMIEHFKPKTVITSSPCFLNPRGIVWMTLDMLGAVMSKTDLHFLNPWEFAQFCEKNGYKLQFRSCDYSWAGFDDMLSDLEQRIPLALKDGNLPVHKDKIDKFLEWLLAEQNFNYLGFPDDEAFYGATMVYRIDIP